MTDPSPEVAAVLVAQLTELERSIIAAKKHFAAIAGFTPVVWRAPDEALPPQPPQPTPLTPAEEARVELLKLREKQALMMLQEAVAIFNGRVGENWGARSAARHLLDLAKSVGPLPDGMD